MTDMRSYSQLKDRAASYEFGDDDPSIASPAYQPFKTAGLLTMKYKISRKHVFLDNEPVLMYFIENIPFQFDTLERKEKQDLWILSEAAINEEYTLKDIITSSEYLLREECHPVIFELDLVNPELIPE